MTMCACGKRAHPTEALAEAHRDAVIDKEDLFNKSNRSKKARLLKVYQCATGSWHIGHPEKKR